MRRSAIFALLSAAMLVVACSDGGVIRPTDGGGGDLPPQTCGAATCNGCCLGNTCVTGDQKSACGSGGGACTSCGEGLICQPNKCIPESTGCSASNCPTGCCKDNTCRSGVGNDACGTGGAACVDCAASSGVCSAANRTCLSSCTPNCTGKCAGADDGCGGKCQVNDCRGCCIGEQCTPGVTNAACGKDGAQCSDCTKSAGSKCGADQKCSSCTPNCAGKCAGAADECGGTCTTSSCPGCCVGFVCELGSADNACGKGGAACADCAAQGSSCTSGSCGSTCTPNCSGKCKGASDGCGGTCQSNSCTGCCDNANCLPGKSDTACGKSGAQCYVCPTDFQGFKWKCDSTQTCVKDTPTGDACTGKTGGTASCTENGDPGKCWNEKCCVGCWNASVNACWKYANSLDGSCGIGGIACVDCKATSQECNASTYKCETPQQTGPCAGKSDLDACTDGGKTGKCISGSCCTGCYYSSSGSLTCQASPNDTRCGKNGGSCSACKAYQNCDATAGSCKLDPNANFKFIAEKASMLDIPGKTWDTNPLSNPEPDPYFGVKWGSTCSVYNLSKCSGSQKDTFKPQWDYDMGTFKASALLGEHCFFVIDNDGVACVGPFETMAQCKATITETDIQNGFKYIFGCPHPSDGKDYTVFILLDFQHVP
jgi:hypothetical protein